jgi:hypothetical protein
MGEDRLRLIPQNIPLKAVIIPSFLRRSAKSAREFLFSTSAESGSSLTCFFEIGFHNGSEETAMGFTKQVDGGRKKSKGYFESEIHLLEDFQNSTDKSEKTFRWTLTYCVGRQEPGRKKKGTSVAGTLGKGENSGIVRFATIAIRFFIAATYRII